MQLLVQGGPCTNRTRSHSTAGRTLESPESQTTAYVAGSRRISCIRAPDPKRDHLVALEQHKRPFEALERDPEGAFCPAWSDLVDAFVTAASA
jgi:hypothetical protein